MLLSLIDVDNRFGQEQREKLVKLRREISVDLHIFRINQATELQSGDRGILL